jgi:hypothetical protein
LQEVEIKQEKEIAKRFEEVVILNVPCIIQDNNYHNAHILSNELNKGNENVAMLVHEENCLNKDELSDNASLIPLPK